MSIKFFCSCGKRLKAKDDMAARRTICPACGNPVGVPSLQPTQRGTAAAPLSPLERLAREQRKPVRAVAATANTPELPEEAPRFSPREPALALSPELDPEKIALPQTTGIVLRIPVRRKSRRQWQAWPLETRWHQCLFYPLLAFPLVLGLALLFTIMSGVTVLNWPNIVELPEQEPYLWWLPCVLFPLLLVGYACGFYRCALASALAGEAGEIRWPGYDVLLVLKSTLISLVCFLEGPVLLTGIAYFFWLQGGDPTLGDQLILWELLVVAVAYFCVLFLAVCLGNSLRDANPARLVELIIELGWRGRIIVLGGALLLVGDGLLVLDALGSLQPSSGWLPLFGWWAAGFYLLTLFSRWLGLYCHYHFQLGRRKHTPRCRGAQ
jgi:hypothetical protein